MENEKSIKLKSRTSFVISIIAISLSITGFVLSHWNWQELEVIIQSNYDKSRSININALEKSFRKDTISEADFLDTLGINLFISNNGTKREILRHCKVLYINENLDTFQCNYSSKGMVGIPAYIEPKEASLVSIKFPVNVWGLYKHAQPQNDSIRKIRLIVNLESYWYDLTSTKTASWIDLEIAGEHGIVSIISNGKPNVFVK